MSQERRGVVNVEEDSATVIGLDTFWTETVSPGNLFIVEGDIVSYEIANVVSDTELELTTPYSGDSEEEIDYTIHQSFTPNNNYPFPEKGDIETATIVKQAIKRIDDGNYGSIPAGEEVLHTGFTEITDAAITTTSGDENSGYWIRADGWVRQWRTISPDFNTTNVQSFDGLTNLLNPSVAGFTLVGDVDDGRAEFAANATVVYQGGNDQRWRLRGFNTTTDSGDLLVWAEGYVDV